MVEDVQLLGWPPWSQVDDRGLARFVTPQANRWLALPISFNLAEQLDGQRIVAKAVHDTLTEGGIRYAREE